MVRAALRGNDVARVDEVLLFSSAILVECGKRVAPLLLILLAVAVATMLVQVGLLFTWQPLMPSLAKINPLTGLQRLFSMRGAMHAATSFAKLLVVAAVAYFTMGGSIAEVLQALMLEAQTFPALAGALTMKLAVRLGAAFFVLSLLDYAWQRFRHERDLRMTKEEVKDELRSMEGDPHIKRRRRQLQMQLALQRLRRDLPKADVVVTNPAHVAVALRYQAEEMPAPKVIAKGADYVALRIRQLAAEFGIPIVERPPLARALYEAVDVGQYIPERLYQAIAEVLAYVYELTGRPPRGVHREVAAAP
jgi:flagellar biosynthetic protein FlhB